MNLDEILSEIVEMSSEPPLGELEFTIRDYRKKTGISREGASHRLNKLVDDGVLGTAMRFDRRVNRMVRAWWKIAS